MLPHDLMCSDSQYDFTAFWPAGVLARLHDYSLIYDPAAFLAWRQAHLCVNALRLDWYYPPPNLLPVMLVSLLPFKPALLVWIAFLTMLSALMLRLARLPWSVIGCGLLSPAALYCDELAQLGILAGALLVAGLMLTDKNPISASVSFALLLFKPQEALLVPVAVLAQRNFRVFAGTALLVLLILTVSILVLGRGVYADYWRWAPVSSRAVLDWPAGPKSHQNYGISVFWMMRSFGWGLPASYAIQLIISLICALLVWQLWRPRERKADALDRMALTVFLSLLVTPYGYAHDLVGYSVALAALAHRRGWRIDIFDTVFWLWPPLSGAIDRGVVLTPCIVGLAAIRTWFRVRQNMPRECGTGIATFVAE